MPEGMRGIEWADDLRSEDETPELAPGPLANRNAGDAGAVRLSERRRRRQEQEEGSA